jgi:hypothetical protein
MASLQQVRSQQEEQVEKLRKLQRDKAVAPAQRKEAIQHDIELVQKDIQDLDNEIQRLINESKTKSL